MIRNYSKTKHETNKGATMMVAIIIMGILMVFAFSLLLVTYNLYASQNKKAASRRNSSAANTLSIALERELTDGGNIEDYDPMLESDLWKYLRFNIGQSGTWPYYYPEAGYSGHGKAEAFRYFQINYNYVEKYFNSDDHKALYPTDGENTKTYYDPTVLDGFPGSVELCVYWKLPEELEQTYKSIEAPLVSQEGKNKINMNGARLYIEIICETASQTYVVTNEYKLQISELNEYKRKNALEQYSKKDTYNPMGFSITEPDRINLNEDWVWDFESRE